jgi:probable HAF family extracellular repeat protein
MTMTSTARAITVRRRLGVLIAGAVVLTALSVATAGASAPAPMRIQAARLSGRGVDDSGSGLGTGLGGHADRSTGPRSRLPVFVLDKGRFSAFDAPGQEAAEFQRINNRGEIVGSYSTGRDAPLAGYLRDKRGRFTEIAVPGAVATAPLDNNDRGELMGNYQLEVGGALRGFLRDRRGRYATIQVPGSLQTQAAGINNRGQVVGDYQDAAGRFHGYLWTRGRFATIDGPAGTGASLTNLNDRGQIIGLYAPTGDPARLDGFVLSGGRYATFDLDAATALTLPLGINNRGMIAGFTAARFDATADANAHGFVLRQGAGGAVTRIDVPGALGTGAMGINDRDQIVGLYLNPDAAPTPLGAPAGVPVPGAFLGLGPMGSNDPELGPRRNAGQPADASGAFIYRKGRYTPLDTLNGRPTAHTGINNRGQIVGGYDSDGMTLRGFVRDEKGNDTGFDAAPGVLTAAFDINDRGQILLPAPGAFFKGRAVPIGG